jgi:hypothetical protein
MTLNLLLAQIKKQHEADLKVLKLKNHDYAGNSDALANLRDFGSFGVIVRLSDKFSRLKRFVRSGGVLAVKDETIFETLLDIRNYAHIAEVMMKEEKAEKK